jgi:hypothetical protein
MPALWFWAEPAWYDDWICVDDVTWTEVLLNV